MISDFLEMCLEEKWKLISSAVLWTYNLTQSLICIQPPIEMILMFEMLHCTILLVSMTANSPQKQSVCLLVSNSTTHFTILHLCLWPFKQGLRGPGVNIWMALLKKARRPCYVATHKQIAVTNPLEINWSYSSISRGLSLGCSPKPTFTSHKTSTTAKKKYLNEILFMFVKFSDRHTRSDRWSDQSMTGKETHK